MLWWDEEFLEVLKKNNLAIIRGARYMDDVRLWLRAIRLGWRWQDGKAQFRKEWREEEMAAGMTLLQKTSEVLEGAMNSVCSWLRLTMEHEEMFNGVLPTLDLIIWVSKENKVLFSFFEKEMVSPMVLHKRSAMPESIRRATLNQELVRRMINTSELVDMGKRLEVVDNYAQKLINSEYNMKETVDVIIGGLKGYERLLSLSRDPENPRWKPLHVSGKWNSRNRRMAKLRARDNWFKGRQEVELPEDGDEQTHILPGGSRQDTTLAVPVMEQMGDMETNKTARKSPKKLARKCKKRGPDRRTLTLGGEKRVEKAEKRRMKRMVNKEKGKAGIKVAKKTNAERVMMDPPVSVLFVDNTKNGTLAKRLQEEEKRLGGITSYRVRVVESAGMALSRLLPSTNPWGPGDCGREDCAICSQGDETQQDCRRRNILYQSQCQVCSVKLDKEDDREEQARGLYIGESSRSMFERAKEHVRDRDGREEDSHQVKHWLIDHGDLASPPPFKFKILASFQDPLTRQIAESVRIEGAGEGILNSRSEYSRCRVPRLRLDMEGWKRLQKEQVPGKECMTTINEVEEGLGIIEDDIRRQASKRGAEEKVEKRTKKRKFPRLEGWGEGVMEPGDVNVPLGGKQTGHYPSGHCTYDRAVQN